MDKKGSTKDTLKELAELDAEQEELFARRGALMKSIEAQLKVVNDEIAHTREQRDKVAASLVAERGLEGLMTDAEFSSMAYNAHWNGGTGSKEVGDAFDALVADVPFLRFHTHAVSDEDYSEALSIPQVAIPRGAADERIEELADVLEPLMSIQREIAEGTDITVRIAIMEDSLARFGSYRIEVDEDDERSWMVTGGVGSGSVSGSLYEVLLHVSENLTYGATDEYEAAMPDWRIEQEADYEDGYY